MIIRIYLSPGNFRDYNTTPDDPSPERHLTRTDQMPAGATYCGTDQPAKIEAYRNVLDIVNEMKEIYELNTSTASQWPADSFYFEPANEPNQEWYAGFKEKRDITTTLDPDIDNSEAWANMDAYFAALITLSKSQQPRIQVLTPPMSQGLYAERLSPGSCGAMPCLVA